MENFRPVMTTVPVNDLFAYIATFFASSENVKLVMKNAGNIEIYTDENYLRTIMQNLTANAIKALGNSDNACITWEVVNDGQTIKLSIRDNGPGMNPVELNAFYANEPVANKKYGFRFIPCTRTR